MRMFYRIMLKNHIVLLDLVHGGPKFGPLPPPSRDSICMPSPVWSTDFLFEIFDHVINSRRIRRFGPYSNSSNTQVWSSLNREKGRIRIVCDHVASNQFDFAGLVHFSIGTRGAKCYADN